ncbi:proliferation marker protein Ki-67 isoform 2-T2 [Trichechus inunguis]
MGPLGRLVVIRRTGSDGTHFPLCRDTCLFGRGIECDIRIQLPVVSQQHCKIDIRQQEALLINFSTTNPTQLNGAPFNEPVKLKHGDIITIIDRSFRFESGSFPEGSNSTECPEQQRKEESVRQAEDATDSEKLSSEKKGSIPTNANASLQSTDTDVQQQKFPAQVLSQIKRKTPNASPRKPKMRLGYPEVTSSHTSSFDDSTSDITENKSEEMSFKRRRVSFGSLLRPELFDENLPPNTPLKRGETPGKRKSLGIPAPTVLKKIMREQSLAPEKGESSSNVLSEAKSSTASNSSKSQRPNNPKRRSEKIPSRRKSVDKNTLQIIFPKRRSSTSKAKLPGGKSWADVVKLGAKKQQIKNIKQDAQRHISKKQRRKPTPQKPLDHIENPFSTGHANSPCTVIIGRAHVDKVNVPARPYRMLNNFILNKKITYTEDLSGLTEMFKTPGKEKPQRTNVCPDSIKRSEMVFEEAKLGEKPETLDVIDKILLPTKQEVEVEDISQKPSKQKPKPGETLAALKTWLKAPNVSPELLEDLCSKKDRTPTPESPRKSISGDVPRKIWKTTKCTPESREMTRMSPRLWRNPCASLELKENLTGMNDHMRTLKSPGESISNEKVHTEIQKTPKRTPKSGKTSRKALSLLRNTSASPELVEDLASMKDQTPTPESPGEPISGDDNRKIQKTPKCTSKSAETPRMSLRLLRSPSANPELMEDPASMKDQTPMLESPGESVSGDDHRKIEKTPKHTLKSGETPRLSLTLLGDLSASPELVEDLSGMIAPMPTLESAAESISGEEVHREIRKTPKCTPKSGEMQRKSLRLLRNPSASQELVEDLAGINDHMPTLKSPGESISNEEVHREIQKTLKHTPKSEESPRMSPRLWRNPSASPELMEDLSGMNDHMPTPKSPGESISNEEVHRGIRKTPKYTPKSRETPRMSLSLLRNPSASPKLVEDLAGIKDQTPTAKSPGVSISCDDHRKTQKTPKHTLKSGETPRMSPRLCKDPNATLELVEDLASMKDHTPTPREPDEPESLVSPIGKSLLRPPLKLKPEPVEALTLNLLKTPPQTVPPEHQAVNTKLGAAPREESEPLTGVRKHLRNSTKKIAPVEEPTGIKTPVRTPKRSYEWMGNLSGLKSLMKTPRVHPEEDSTHIAKFLTESDSGILTSPEKLQESQVLRRPVTKGSPVEDLEPPKLMEVASAAFEETSDSATKNKDGAGDSQENPSCNPCEDESQTNASEKNMEDSGINQRTRYALRNKGGPELQESKHLPHQTEKVESETNVKTTEPSIQANLRQGTSLRSRRRCKADTEVQESQLLPSTETIQINKGEMKTLKSSQKKTSEDGPTKEKAVTLRSRGRSKTGINLPETESLASLAEVIYTEEDDKPMESLQEKIKPTSEEKIVLRSRKKTNSNFGLVTRSNKIFPAKTEEPDVSSSTAARVSVSNDEKTVTHSLDKVFTEKIATRGLRSRCGPGTINPGSEACHSPLSTTEKADSGEVGKTRGRKHQKRKETALKQEARVKTRHQRTHLGEETQHSHSLPAPREEVSTDKEMALKQEARVKTRHQRKHLGEETQHSHSLPAPREEVSTDKEAALRQETRMKTRHQRMRLGEEMQHSHSLPAPCEEVSTDKEAALRQETRMKTRHQRMRLGEEMQHSHSLPAPCEEVSTDKEAALRQETRMKTRHQRMHLGEEMQHSHSLPAPCEEVSADKEAALRQQTGVKTRHQRTRLDEETQHSHSLPTSCEEVSTDKDREDKRMLNHTVPPQDGRGLRSRSRNKVSTDPEGLQSVASSTETKRTKKVTKMSVKKSRQQEEAAATEAIPCSRPGRRNKVPVTTTKMQGSDPEPSTENTLEKSAEDPSGKVSEDRVTVPGIPPSRLRSRNQTKSVAELCSKEIPTKEPSHKESGIKSLQRATRASKRGISEETATKNPKQDKNIIPTKRMRTRRYQGNEDA